MKLDCCGSQGLPVLFHPEYFWRQLVSSPAELLSSCLWVKNSCQLPGYSEPERGNFRIGRSFPWCTSAHGWRSQCWERRCSEQKFSFAQGRPPQPIGTSLWVQHQIISLQAKVMDPSHCHKLRLDTLHNPSCSKAVSVMLSFHGPIILPNMPPSSHTNVKAVLASFSVVWLYFICKFP